MSQHGFVALVLGAKSVTTDYPDLTNLTDHKGLIITHLNIRSLLPKITQLRADLLYSPVDVFCISETWLNKSITNGLISIDGYSLERHDRNWSDALCGGPVKTGGGVCIFIRKSLQYGVNLSHWISSPDLEMICITLVPSNCRKCIIFCCYRPPKGNLEICLKSIEGALLELTDTPSRLDICILGDFNVDLNQQSPASKRITGFCEANNLTQLISNSTRVTPSTSTCIDHAYIKAAHITQHGCVDVEFSDHKLIYVIKKKLFSKRESTSYVKRDMKNFDAEVITSELLAHNWGRYYALQCPNLAWDYLFNVIRCVLDNMCPFRTFRSRVDTPEWYNEEITSLAHRR